MSCCWTIPCCAGWCQRAGTGRATGRLPWPGAHLNLALGTINTTVLLLSSGTCQMGVFAVERGQIRRSASIWNPAKWGLREWYVLSFLMGLYFVLGQGYEYLSLIRDGLTLQKPAPQSGPTSPSPPRSWRPRSRPRPAMT